MHPRTEVIQSGKVRNLDVTESLTYQGSPVVPGGGVDTDEKSKVSSNDTTAGYLNGKLVAGTNITLTENNDGGNETLTIAASGGGGGTTGFTPTQNVAAPNDTVNASRLLVDAASTNADAVLQPKGTGAVLAQLPDSTTTGGDKRGANAVDLQTTRANSTRVASGTESVVVGGRDNRATNTLATTCGGLQNSASGERSFIGGGGFNIASTTYAAIASGDTNSALTARSFIGGGQSNTISTAGTHQVIGGGQSNTANATHATVAGGSNNVASGSYAISAGGDNNTASGTNSTISGGNVNTANASYATVVGGQRNLASGENSVSSGFYAIANTFGMRSHASGRFVTIGDAQVQEMVVRAQTTSGAQGELTANQLPWTTANTMQVPTDGALAFDILIVARRTDADNECAAWTIRGCIDNNAGVVAFVGTPTKTVLGDDSAGVWDVAADTDASQRLRVLCVGEVGKTINWVAHIRATRVVG